MCFTSKAIWSAAEDFFPLLVWTFSALTASKVVNTDLMGLLLQTNAVTGTFPWVSLEKIKNQIVKKLVTSILIILCLSFNNLFFILL